jgi:hypothetical protein
VAALPFDGDAIAVRIVLIRDGDHPFITASQRGMSDSEPDGIAILAQGLQVLHSWQSLAENLLIHQAFPYFFRSCLECVCSLNVHRIIP